MACIRLLTVTLLIAAATGCMSPYYADRGALVGGLGGAGLGAIVGNAVGNTAAGAVIGAGAGALSGAAVGGALDDIEARNRAAIESQIGYALPAGTVTQQDVINMTQAGVDPGLIVNHIRTNGVVTSPTSSDLIRLQQAGVAREVIEAMQAPPPQVVQAVPAVATTPVIVEEHYYGRPYYPYPRYGYYYHHHGCRPRRGVHWGVAVSN